MKTSIKYFMAVVLLIVAHTALAQNANSILDKTSSAMKNAGNVKIGFTMNAEGGSNPGYIKLQGQKFVINMGGTTTWFDGTTMWSYVKKNEEVNVTTPTANEVARMNPYAMITFYKKGYKAKMGNSTAKEYEILLTGESGSPYTSVTLRVKKSNYEPTYIHITSAKGNVTEIHCNSFQKNQKYNENTFKFNKKNYPKAEVVDLR